MSNINFTEQTHEIVELYLQKQREKYQKRLEKRKMDRDPYVLSDKFIVERKNDTHKIAKYIEYLKKVSNTLQQHKTPGGLAFHIRKADSSKIDEAAELIRQAIKALEEIK